MNFAAPLRPRRALLLAFALAGCSGDGFNIREAAGLSTVAPDEFTVVSAQPLSVPPQFRLPAPGSETDVSRKRESAASDGAALLHGEAATPGEARPASVGEPTPQQRALLDKLGAGSQDSSAREALDKETAARDELKARQASKKGSSFLSALRPDKPSDDKVIDPSAERERLKKTQESGAPVTGEGAVNAPPARDTGVIGKLFGK